VLDWFDRYVKVDDRFRIDVAGSLRQGDIIWATATFNGPINAGGDSHVARLLMTTTFDGTGSTVNRATMTRVVCNNTLDAAMADRQRSLVRTRHSTKFDPAKVGSELAKVVNGFKVYQAMGDAMACVEMADKQVSDFFKSLLDIPRDAKSDDISARKMNQFLDLSHAYSATVREGTPKGTAWCALNAVTRYVDHERSTRGGDATESRFLSAQFGSGAAMKGQAVDLLAGYFPDIARSRELVAA
jgi:phage/plasmid-like protein (TIGR03299 family)